MFRQKNPGPIGEEFSELREIAETLALQPRPLTPESNLTTILVASIGDHLDRLLGNGGVGRFRAGNAARIRPICHDIENFFVRYVEVLEEHQSKHDAALYGHRIDNGSNLFNSQERS